MKHPQVLFLASCVLLLPLWAANAGALELDGVKLEFSAPDSVLALSAVPIECALTGTGEVTVQAISTDRTDCEKHFDTAVPHKIAFRLEYLGEEGGRASFRVTNSGDTIWKAGGYGKTYLADRLFLEAYIYSDVLPGQSLSKTYPISRMRPRDADGTEREFVMKVERGDTIRRSTGTRASLQLLLPDNKPGQIAEKELLLETRPLIDDLEEYGHAFAHRMLDGKPVTVRLKVQVQPWADRVVVRLIKDGKMKAASLPIKVSQDSLSLGGKPNTRWTLDGKPIFVAVNVPTHEIPDIRRQLGGTDNIVLATDWSFSGDSSWTKAVREHGFKVFPYSAMYVRLQMVSERTGIKLMQGAPLELNIQRADALDPNFPRAMADFIDRMYEGGKDVLFRTTDGKVPICLSGEQSYGYPWWAQHLPTRWGGSSAADVAAFRDWLKEEYGTIGKLNAKWKWNYKDFEEIDPSTFCLLYPPEYPDPWKEWGPAIEDFDTFRSKIHGEFWAKTVAEIKKRHPDIICGMNVFGDYASETEPIYHAFFNWGIKDYQGKGINWIARRTGCLPEDLMCFDFFVSWNTGSPEAAEKNLNFWRKRGKEVVILARQYSKVTLGGDQELRTHAPLGLGINGWMLTSYGSSYFTTLKATYENGGICGVLNDPYIGGRMNATEQRDIALFNQLAAKDSSAK